MCSPRTTPPFPPATRPWSDLSRSTSSMESSTSTNPPIPAPTKLSHGLKKSSTSKKPGIRALLIPRWQVVSLFVSKEPPDWRNRSKLQVNSISVLCDCTGLLIRRSNWRTCWTLSLAVSSKNHQRSQLSRGSSVLGPSMRVNFWNTTLRSVWECSGFPVRPEHTWELCASTLDCFWEWADTWRSWEDREVAACQKMTIWPPCTTCLTLSGAMKITRMRHTCAGLSFPWRCFFSDCPESSSRIPPSTLSAMAPNWWFLVFWDTTTESTSALRSSSCRQRARPSQWRLLKWPQRKSVLAITVWWRRQSVW